MLYLDAPIGPIRGLVIYRDHADPNLFYYVPERPRLARNDGVPEFVMLKYRRDITDNPDFDPELKQSLGGGFLAFTVDLGVDDDELDRIKGELSRFATGNVKLTPIPFRKGSVRLSIMKDAAEAEGAQPDEPKGFRFFEEVYGTSMPSIVGFNRATFAVALSQEAATLFEAGLRSGISPIGVIYDLEFLGLRPAFNVRITAEYHRIYDHLEAEFGARGQIQAVSLGVDIGVAFQKLRDEGAIKVEVLKFTDDDDLRKQADEAFNWFKTDLLKEFFQTAMQPPSFMNRTNSGGLLGQLTNLLGALGSSQQGTPAPQRGAPTTEAPTPSGPPNTIDSNVASTAEANRSAGAGSAGGGGGSTSAASSMSPFQVAFSLKFYHQEELKTRVFEYSESAAVAQPAAPQGLFSTMVDGLDLNRAIVEVSLDDDFFKRLIADISTAEGMEAAGISKIDVNLEYPGERKVNEPAEHVDGFAFTPQEHAGRTFTTWLNNRKNMTYRYRTDVFFRPDSPWVGKESHVTTDWVVTGARRLTIDPLDNVGLFPIAISLGDMDSGEVEQVQVNLKYDDAANDFHAEKSFVLASGGSANAEWKLRLSDPDRQEYQYQVTYFLKDGLRYRLDWKTETSPTLVIHEPFEGMLDVRLVPLLDKDNLIEANLNFEYEEPGSGYRRTMSIILDPTNLTGRNIKIPTLSQEPGGYTYDLTIVRADGSIFSDSFSSGEVLSPLVVSDGTGVTKRIKVKLLNSDMSSTQLLALKVNLVGPGDDPDRAEVLFTPSQTGEQMVALVQPIEGNTFTYHYDVTGFNARGIPVPGDTGESSDQVLLIGLPA